MTVYMVTRSEPDYDCGSAWTSVLNDKGYKTAEDAYNAMIADILKEMNLKSIDEIPDEDDYEACDAMREYGIDSWGVPKTFSEHVHKTCDAYLKTCDGEITYEIQTIEVDD